MNEWNIENQSNWFLAVISGRNAADRGICVATPNGTKICVPAVWVSCGQVYSIHSTIVIININCLLSTFHMWYHVNMLRSGMLVVGCYWRQRLHFPIFFNNIIITIIIIFTYTVSQKTRQMLWNYDHEFGSGLLLEHSMICKKRNKFEHLNRRSQDFVWGCTFFPQESCRPIFSRRLRRTV